MPENFDLSPLLQAAVQLHELMLSCVSAGFSEEQAFRMVLEVLRASQQS